MEKDKDLRWKWKQIQPVWREIEQHLEKSVMHYLTTNFTSGVHFRNKKNLTHVPGDMGTMFSDSTVALATTESNLYVHQQESE